MPTAAGRRGEWRTLPLQGGDQRTGGVAAGAADAGREGRGGASTRVGLNVDAAIAVVASKWVAAAPAAGAGGKDVLPCVSGRQNAEKEAGHEASKG